MRKDLLRISLWSMLVMLFGGSLSAKAQDVTATWDYANATIMESTMAFSGTSEAGKVASIENNGIEMIIEANGATFRNNGNNIQVRTGAVFKVPVKNIGDLVTVKGYPGYSKYTIGSSTEVLTDENSYKAKAGDVENGFVAVTSADANNYYYSLSVVQKAPKEATTLENEAATATFPSIWVLTARRLTSATMPTTSCRARWLTVVGYS